MTRVGVLFATILPSIFAGGLLFGSAPGHADAGREDTPGFWPAAPEVAPDATTGGVTIAQADPRPRTRTWGPMVPPVPPPPPAPGPYAVPPSSPLPPRHRGHGHGHGMSVSIHDGKIEIDGIEEMVQEQLDRVADVLDSLSDVPPDVRDRVKARVKAVRATLKARLRNLESLDFDKIGPEMERMGDELEKDMEGLDKDLEQLGGNLGKHFAEKFGKDFARNFGPGRLPAWSSHDRDNSDDGDDDADDDGDRSAVPLPPGADTDPVDPPDMRAAIADLKDLSLDQGQREQLARLRADSDRQVADARRELEAMSNRLHDTLGDAGASEADIAEQIDLISRKEATIRKARILAWVRARAVLDGDQRKRVEAAAKRGH